MNYAELNTASDILEAFSLCKDPGEEIELFECLATRPDPPVSAFVEILQKVKLEPALVLTIKAFGIITDADVKEQLKQSDDLLVVLSKQAESGASDLIRWTAAVAIDKVGFSFLEISQYFSEEPAKIAEKIMESKKNILIAFSNTNECSIITSREFINFWLYGSTYDLRAITSYCHGNNLAIVVEAVLVCQNVYGIKETNKLLKKAKKRDYPDEPTKIIYENELFEQFTQAISLRLLEENKDRHDRKLLILNLIYCLQSNAQVIRAISYVSLFATDFYDRPQEVDPDELPSIRIVEIFFECDSVFRDYFDGTSYLQLVDRLRDLQEVIQLLSRDKVIQYCNEQCGKISQEIWNRKSYLESQKYSICQIKSKISRVLPQVISIDNTLYINLKQMAAETTPEANVESDDSLDEYKNSLMTRIENLNKDYHDRSWKQISILTSLGGEISGRLSKLREKDSSSYYKDSGEIIGEMILPGCGCAFWGLVFMAIPNIVCTFIGLAIIAIFILIVVVRTSKSQQISDLQKNEVDNTSRIEEMKEKMKVINSLITSLSE